MQRSSWAFAVVETVHLLALAALGGSALILSLRTLGVLKPLPARALAANLVPVAAASFATILITGVLMVSEEALKCYYNPAFRVKIAAFALATLISAPLCIYQVRRQTDRAPWWLRGLSALSLLAWFATGVAGRAIGFL